MTRLLVFEGMQRARSSAMAPAGDAYFVVLGLEASVGCDVFVLCHHFRCLGAYMMR